MKSPEHDASLPRRSALTRPPLAAASTFIRSTFDVRCSMFDVQCSCFNVQFSYFNVPLIILFTVLHLMTPAYAQKDKKPQPKKVTYQAHIRPLFRKHCFTCHNAAQAKSDLDLTRYRTALAGGSSGESLVPGDPSQSRLYLLVTHAEKPGMPLKRPRLPKMQLNLIKGWIEGGLLETSTSKPRQTTKPKSVLAMRLVPVGKPSGPAPMPKGLPVEGLLRTLRGNAITALASSPWAPVVAVGGQKQVLLYHTDTHKLLGVLPFAEGLAFDLKFSRNGRLLLAAGGRGGDSGRVVVWDIVTGKRAFEVGDEFDVILAADINADHSRIALGGEDRLIRVYSTQGGKLLREIKNHTDWISALEFSPDGKLLASADRSGGLVIWETKTGDKLYTLRGHRSAVTAVSWRGDSLVLASSSEDGTIKLWDSRDGNLAKGWTAHEKGVLSVKFAHDGRLATCGRDGATTTWDQNGATIRNFDEFTDVATRVTFTHSGSHVVAGDWTGRVAIWNTADGQHVGNLPKKVTGDSKTR